MKSFSLMTLKGNSNGKRLVYSPYDASLLGEVATGGSDVVEMALEAAHEAYCKRSLWLPVYERIAICENLINKIKDQAEELAFCMAQEGGKPLIDSRVEVERAIEGVQSCIAILRTQGGHEIPMNLSQRTANRIAFTHKEPIGVVVAFSAFNHPFNLIVHQVMPAIAAGCPIIIKPSEKTPLSCMRLISLLYEAGLPQQWCQALITTSLEDSQRLLTDPRVAYFSFIGSGQVGWMLRSKLAPGTRCSLELGGAAPVIISQEMNEKQALNEVCSSVLKGGFYHAGQVCVSVQRVFVHASIALEFAHRLAEGAQALRVGDPTSDQTDVGPLISSHEVKRVDDWVRQAVEQGAQCLCGGKALSESCYACTVLFDPPQKALVSQQEIFGPVICVYPYRDLDEAIERANALPFAFQAAVFTEKLDVAMHVYQHIKASALMVNDHCAFRADWAPFAGLGQSGYGVGGIPYTIAEMQIDKMLVIKSKKL